MAGERDPRAHWLDDDPFDKQNSPGSHTKARDDGNWRQPHIRVVRATPGSGAPFVRIFGFEEQARPIPIHTGSIWHFSRTEIEHLTQATIAFAIALGFMFSTSDQPQCLTGHIFYLVKFTKSNIILSKLPCFIYHPVIYGAQIKLKV